jgi:tRNA-specific 2-thiouridylase
MSQREKIVVAMSGGVDSSVAAALLVEQGYDVMGVFLRLGSPDGVGAHGSEDECKIDPNNPPKKNKQGCCSVLDAGDARRVAQMLDVPFYVLNFQDEFGRIVDYFVGEYNRGRTPNPCVRCNDWLKFGRLVQYARGVGAKHVATGHYARTGRDPVTGDICLMRGLDHSKDQSYVLFGMKPETIAMTLLPIGEMEKPVVRKMAEERGLLTFNKPDSQEICFVPDQDYAGLVKRKSPERVRQGEVVDASGKVLATHDGHQHFTIGQRKGIRLAVGKPVYVVDIDADRNRVVIGDKDQLARKACYATQLNLPVSRAANARREPIRCEAKIRYNASPVPATMVRTGDDEIRVEFDEPQHAVTPGQAVVCYDGDVVLGGGWIERAE